MCNNFIPKGVTKNQFDLILKNKKSYNLTCNSFRDKLILQSYMNNTANLSV